MSPAVATRRRNGAGRQRRSPRIGLALAGGGPLGGIYEVGTLLALSDSLHGLDLNELEVYVGVSSGGFVSAALANGISPAQMYRLFIEDDVDASLTPALFLRPAFREFARRAGSLPRLLAEASAGYLKNSRPGAMMESLSALGRATA